MNTKTLIDEAMALPVEERAMIVDSLLKSLNQPESELDKKWAEVAKRRIHELKSGQVKPIPGDEVFAKIWLRFDK
jgi:putative addiction module component (TIGR02574 family)